ncbi:MAG: DUF5320 domain-containing protein [Candidatus Saccharimonadales bacterium]
MSNLDGTGRMGQGPMTGKRLGNCAVCGGQYRGMARCRGCGLGIGRFWASPKNSLADLKAIETQLVEDLDDLKQEISQIENQSNK